MSRQFLIIWTLLMGATLAWMFWPEGQDGLGKSLATLKSSEGSVQLRRAGSFVWSKGSKGNSLFALDSIATEASSRAVIQLGDGTEIILPPDTQLKIQPQSLSEGVEIAVVKGGVSVQKAKIVKGKALLSSKGGADGSGNNSGRPGSRSSLAGIQTARYRIDLTALQGTFSLGSDAAVKAEKPDSVVVESQGSSLSLAQLNKEGDSVVATDHNDAIFEVEELPPVAPPPPPVAVVEPPKPKPRPTKILQAKPMLKAVPPPEPVALALAEPEDDGELVFPEWKLEKNQLWIGGSLASNATTPISIPAVWNMPDANDKWYTVLRVSTPALPKSLVIRRRIGAEGYTFTLAELRALIPNLDVRSS